MRDVLPTAAATVKDSALELYDSEQVLSYRGKMEGLLPPSTMQLEISVRYVETCEKAEYNCMKYLVKQNYYFLAARKQRETEEPLCP